MPFDFVMTNDGHTGTVMYALADSFETNEPYETSIYSFKTLCQVPYMSNELLHIPLDDMDFFLQGHVLWTDDDDNEEFSSSRNEKPISPYDVEFLGYQIGNLMLDHEYNDMNNYEYPPFETLSDVCR